MAASDFIASSLYVETLAPPSTAQRSALRECFLVTITAIEIATDFLTCIFGIVAVHLLTTRFPASLFFSGALRSALPPGAAFGLIVVALFYRDGAYCKNKGLLQIRETERAIRASVKASFLLLCIRLLFSLEVSWPQFFVSLFAVPALLIIEKQVLSLFVRRLQRNAQLCDRAVIYGRPRELSRRVISTLLQSPRLGLHPVAIVDDSSARSECSIREMGYRGCRSIQVERRPLSPSLLKAYRCEVLALIVSDLSSDEIAAATHAAQQAGSYVAYLRDSAVTDQPCIETIDVDGILFSTSWERLGVWIYLLAKRVVDIVVSSVLIALMLPLLILIAILVRFDSPGPALFVQRRVGRNGELFDMFKFRSMFTHASKYAKSPTTSNDPRITRVGRVLRRLSLDELPQLFNVLTGAMSLVGPRPEMPFIVETYDARQRSRFKVKPGITGIWQLSADRSFPIHQNLEYDFYYIRNWTLSMDAAILIHTLIFGLCRGI
jgi:exopolysaccharide biosynthesis polyprenyl glycosylphosphotransferase